MTTPETTTAMDRFYELMDFITGGPTSEASLAVCDLYAAALARAEAAEAEAARIEHARLYYQERTAIVTAAWDAERANNKAAWQRVAELEAAARWHRGTAKPPGPAWYFVYDLREDDTPLRRYHNGAAWGLPGEEEEPPDWWLPIPPLPQETTP